MTFLGYMDKQLSSIINYELGMWSGPLKFPFWIGEYQETNYLYEQEYHEYSFTMMGTTKGTWAQLEADRDKIVNLLSNHGGLVKQGHSIAIFYDGAMMIPSQDETIKRMQINFTIKEWGK